MWLIDHFRQHMAERKLAKQTAQQRRTEAQAGVIAGVEAAYENWLDFGGDKQRQYALQAARDRVAAEEAGGYDDGGVTPRIAADGKTHMGCK